MVLMIFLFSNHHWAGFDRLIAEIRVIIGLVTAASTPV